MVIQEDSNIHKQQEWTLCKSDKQRTGKNLKEKAKEISQKIKEAAQKKTKGF